MGPHPTPSIASSELLQSPVGNAKTVLVSGCFDTLHSGHVEFLQRAAFFGDLVVALGSDETVRSLKGRYPEIPEQERLFMIQALRCVRRAFIAGGKGNLDFDQELREIHPDVFVVNHDGHAEEKENLCLGLDIEYVVLDRVPHPGLSRRSTTEIRQRSRVPYRIELAGGWLDQPEVSTAHPGSVVVASIEPDYEYEIRSGMATSTRSAVQEIWGQRLPTGDPKKLARILFAFENPPGTAEIAGSQDALGIVLPGLNRLCYRGKFWPEAMESVQDEDTLAWLESILWLKFAGVRPYECQCWKCRQITTAGVRRLADAADQCWEAIRGRDTGALMAGLNESLASQIALFPEMADDKLLAQIAAVRNQGTGVKFTGAGRGGYLIVVSDRSVESAIRPKIRRSGM